MVWHWIGDGPLYSSSMTSVPYKQCLKYMISDMYIWFCKILCIYIYICVCDVDKTKCIFRWCMASLQWRHDGRDGALNHQPHDCLLHRLFRRRSKKTSKLRVTGLCAGIHQWAVNSPHKWPVMRKMFPCDDVIIITLPNSLYSSLSDTVLFHKGCKTTYFKTRYLFHFNFNSMAPRQYYWCYIEMRGWFVVFFQSQ